MEGGRKEGRKGERTISVRSSFPLIEDGIIPPVADAAAAAAIIVVEVNKVPDAEFEFELVEECVAEG
jgi:hypothetical protein